MEPARHYARPGVAPRRTRAGRDWFSHFDEGEQDRRKKGKELVPVMNAFPPPRWTAPPGGYPPGVFGPPGGMYQPFTLPHQPVPPGTFPSGGREHTLRNPDTHMRHHDQQAGASRMREPQDTWPGITVNQVDGVLTPDSGDLTVHLTMDLEEDLEQQLDEMHRLSRMGNFASAKEFFNENLQHHLDNPYVLLQYADLLCHQGDFKGVTLLKEEAMYKKEGDQPVSEALRLLQVNWELLQVLASSHTMDTLNGVSGVFDEAMGVLSEMAENSPLDRPISSTEIEILALTLRLTGDPVLNSKWVDYGKWASSAFSTSLSQLYQSLLRQGRIWDLHDFIVLLPTVEDIKVFASDVFGKELVPSLQAMISDWSESVHGYDTSTTLGLLSMMTHILLEPVRASEDDCVRILKLCLPLAVSVLENDPASLKSRPYLRLLLAKSRFIETASRQAIDSLTTHLQSLQGVLYQPDLALLPIYVPSRKESPRWTPVEQPPELKDPVKLVLRSAIELGDLKTEVLARRELIRLSGDPRDEFDMLCTLQLRQGNLNGYGLSLASKYLASNTDMAKTELVTSFSQLLSMVSVTTYWGPSREWVLNMLLYKLGEKPPPGAHQAREKSDNYYDEMETSRVREVSRKVPELENMEESLLREVLSKVPELKGWLEGLQSKSTTQSKPEDYVLRAESGSHRYRRSTAGGTESPMDRRATEQPPRRAGLDATSGQKEERDTSFMRRSRSGGGVQAQRPISRRESAPFHPVNNGRQSVTGRRGDGRRRHPTPHVSVTNDFVYDDIDEDIDEYNDEYADGSVEPESPPAEPSPVASNVRTSTGLADDKKLEAQIKDRVDAEIRKRWEAEEEIRRRQTDESINKLNDLKKEVEEARKRAVEHAEKKQQVEAMERAEQLKWQRHMEEITSEKAKEMARLKATTAESNARFEAAMEKAIQEAETRVKEEYERRRKKEHEARLQAESEMEKRIAAEKQAQKEAAAAAKRIEEEEKARQWAAERAEKELENQKQIHFQDAVGRKFAIPFSQGRTWKGMQELVEAAFRHVDVIGPEVLAGHYDLQGPDGTIILPQTWDKIIQPDWHITMHMWPMDIVPPPSPPPPLTQSVSTGPVAQGAEESVVNSAERATDDDGTSIYSVTADSLKPSRTRRITSVFSALKTLIFRRRQRRRRRRSWTSDYSSSYISFAEPVSRAESLKDGGPS